MVTQEHHQRQIAPEDVRVVEHRVDLEVLVELVGGDQVRIQTQSVCVSSSPEADQGQHHGQGDGHQQTADQQLASPEGEISQPRQQDRERDVEEDLVLERIDEVRVGASTATEARTAR